MKMFTVKQETNESESTSVYSSPIDVPRVHTSSVRMSRTPICAKIARRPIPIRPRPSSLVNLNVLLATPTANDPIRILPNIAPAPPSQTASIQQPPINYKAMIESVRNKRIRRHCRYPRCGEHFANRCELSLHEMYHRKMDQLSYFICPATNCSHQFESQQELLDHIRTHDGFELPNSDINLTNDGAFVDDNEIEPECSTSSSSNYYDWTSASRPIINCVITEGESISAEAFEPIPVIEDDSDELVQNVSSGEIIDTNAVTVEQTSRSRNQLGSVRKQKSSQNTQFMCARCGIQFKNRCALSLHEMGHRKAEREFACPVPHCFRAFDSRKNLRGHMHHSHVGVELPSDIDLSI